MAENKTQKIFSSIINSLQDGPKSISDIQKKTHFNWRTVEQYLSMLKTIDVVKESPIGKTRTFFYLDKNNYFRLFIKKKDRRLISTIYFYIKKYSREFFNRDPTKTQVYKIMWKVSNKLGYNLPVGWYMHGPCCVQVYTNNEEKEQELPSVVINEVKASVKKYCPCENIELQKKVYYEANDTLYQLKEELLNIEPESDKEVNSLLMDFNKYVPKRARYIISDFIKATILLRWSNTKRFFIDKVWPYIALIRFIDSLRKYYGEAVDIYFEKELSDREEDTRMVIRDLLLCKDK